MHVVVSRSFPSALRGAIEEIVRAGFAGVDVADVETHVKARARTERRYVMEFVRRGRVTRWAYARKRDAEADARRFRGAVEADVRRSPRAGEWSGRAYDGVPGIARVEVGVNYLVTMNIPADPPRLTRYPLRYRDHRLKTAPEVRLESWEEELFHLAAHEACHVRQFRLGLRRSELEAERFALAALEERRNSQRPLTLFDFPAASPVLLTTPLREGANSR